MIYMVLSHFLTAWIFISIIICSYKYFQGEYFKITILTCLIHYFIIVTQNHYGYFGRADITDYEHYFVAFSSLSSIFDIFTFVSPHVPFYTLLYPGWLYSILGPDSFILIRTINFVILLLIVVPLNSILTTIFNTYLQPWQLLILVFLPSTTRYSVMISRDIIAAFFVLAFIALFFKLLQHKNVLVVSLFCIILVSTLFIRIHNVIFIFATFGSLALLNFTYANINIKEKLYLSTVCVLLALSTYIVFINFGPSYHSVTDIESLASVAEGRTEGQTAYLEGYFPNSIIDLVWYLPLHGFYFLFSPMPWHINNIQTLIGFVESWFILGLVITSIIVGMKIITENKLLLLLVMIIVIFAIGFGAGVKNAGGAIRWRLPATILLFTLSTTILNIRLQSKYKH